MDHLPMTMYESIDIKKWKKELNFGKKVIIKFLGPYKKGFPNLANRPTDVKYEYYKIEQNNEKH